MQQLKIDWEEFKQLALDKLKEKYPNITDKPRFVKHHPYEGEAESYEIPTSVYIELL